MKLGILGTGKIVREFLPWLAEHTPFTVQAICSTERSAELAQSLCGQYGVPQHTTNFLELLQWVDVVYIAVPNLQHVRYARVALEAGKHVIVEKPLAPTAAQTEELVNLARHKKVFLLKPSHQYLKLRKDPELLPRIGTVKLVQCNFSQYSSRYDAFCPVHRDSHRGSGRYRKSCRSSDRPHRRRSGRNLLDVGQRIPRNGDDLWRGSSGTDI